MKIFILGATGQTGTILTKRLIESDYSVKAFVRNNKKIVLKNKNLIIEEGEIGNLEQLTQSMKGYDVVVSCLGGNANKRDTVLTNLMTNVVDAMTANNITRIVSISSAGIEDEMPGLIAKIFVTLFYKHAINDHKGAANYIKDHIQNYTLIRPLSLVDTVLTKVYRVSETSVPKGASKISREDLSHFMFDVITKSQYVGKSICPAY